MSISVTTNIVRFVGNNTTLIFGFTFKAFATSEIEVYLIDNTSNALPATLQTETTDYTVSLNEGEGGSVTFVTTAPTDKQDVLILRKSSFIQSTDFEKETNFPEENVEDGLDKKVLFSQELQEQIDRAILFGRGTNESGQVMPEFEASKFLRVKSDNTALEFVTADDILNAASGDEFWNSSLSFAINNGQATPLALDKMTVSNTSERFALWLFGIKRFTDSNEFTGMGFIPVSLNNAGNWTKASETYWPSVGGPDHGITFSIDAAGQMSYLSDTKAGANYDGLMRAKKVILKLNVFF